MSASLTALQPFLQPYARALLSYAPRAVVTSTYRSPSEQLRLWNTRASNPYPVAPPGHSYHEYGRAFDVSADDATLNWLGAVWNYWGGRWSPSDRIHFEV